MEFSTAQKNMRDAYLNGGPGMLASGLVWIIAGLAGLFFTVQASVFTLFIGGMLIHPAGQLIARLLGRSGNHDPKNPLATLALESTIILFVGIFIAFVMVQVQPEFFFPIMLLTIGGRYLLFQTMYGLRLYWIVGGVLAFCGALCLVFSAPFVWGAFIGGAIEIIGSMIFIIWLKETD